MKFSGLACLDIRTFVENFVANKQVREKLSRWRLYTSIRRTWHIQLDDACMRRSAPCAFEHMTHICVIQRRNKGVKLV